jgi:hypothetical protein
MWHGTEMMTISTGLVQMLVACRRGRHCHECQVASAESTAESTAEARL